MKRNELFIKKYKKTIFLKHIFFRKHQKEQDRYKGEY